MKFQLLAGLALIAGLVLAVIVFDDNSAPAQHQTQPSQPTSEDKSMSTLKIN